MGRGRESRKEGREGEDRKGGVEENGGERCGEEGRMGEGEEMRRDECCANNKLSS